MTDETLPRGGYVLLGKDMMEQCQTAAGKHGLLAMMALLWYADNDTGMCWPSVKTLAERVGVSERTMRRAVVQLELAELVTIERRPADSPGPSRYTIHQTIQTRHVVPGPPSENASAPPGENDTPPLAKTPVELDSGTTPKGTKKTPRLFVQAELDEFWEVYGRKDTSKRNAEREWKKLLAELPTQGYLLDQVRAYRLSVFKGRPEGEARQYLLHPERWLKRRLFDAEYTDEGTRGGRLQPDYEPSSGEVPEF